MVKHKLQSLLAIVFLFLSRDDDIPTINNPTSSIVGNVLIYCDSYNRFVEFPGIAVFVEDT